MDRNKQKKHTVAQTGAENNIKNPKLVTRWTYIKYNQNFNTRARVLFWACARASSQPDFTDSWRKLPLFLLIKGNRIGIWFTGDHFIANLKCSKTTPPPFFFLFFFFPQPRQEFKKKCVITISIVISCNFSSVSHQQDIQYSSEE